MKKFVILALIFAFIIFSKENAFAASSYVLPYPSAMPGGISYKVHLVWEKVMQYISFGDFGQFTYNLKESDKYLVEAKTLFEYNQYLLGFTALQKSNEYFAKALPDLQLAKSHGKNSTENRLVLSEASQKHIEVLEKMKNDTPATFMWNPEKAAASQLRIHDLIETAISIRKKSL